MITTSN